MKIVADSHIPFIQDYFGGYGELVLQAGRKISPQDVQDADILLVRSITHVNQALLANSSVKFVGSVTAGKDHVDTKWLNDAGIIFRAAKGFNAPPVADYVVSAIAALQQNHLLPEKNMRAAVIGVGNAGGLVVERMHALNIDVTVCDPIRAAADADFISIALDAIADMDLISLHVPLTKSGEHATHHFINQQFLKKQKPGCILLNASRGSVINTHDLLQYGTHLCWCFDVWEHEPHIDKNILKRAYIATPHIAGYSVQSKIRGIDMIYKMVCETGLLPVKPIVPIVMPKQHLEMHGKHSWQDIVLGVFNPLVITDMMRTLLLPDENHGMTFDEMRNQFNYRHELAYTCVRDAVLSEYDARLLEKLVT